MPEPVEPSLPDELLRIKKADGADRALTLEAEGELDLSTANRLHDSLMVPISEGLDLMVDLTRVSFIDSSGIAALVRAFRSLDGAGRMSVLIAPGSQVARIFEIARLDDALPTFTDRAEAVSGLRAPGAAR